MATCFLLTIPRKLWNASRVLITPHEPIDIKSTRPAYHRVKGQAYTRLTVIRVIEGRVIYSFPPRVLDCELSITCMLVLNIEC